jgi:hypothetical protein
VLHLEDTLNALFLLYAYKVYCLKSLSLNYTLMRFEVFTAVKMWIVVFRVMTVHSFVGGYQSFRGTYHLYLQGGSYPQDVCDMFGIITQKTTVHKSYPHFLW